MDSVIIFLARDLFLFVIVLWLLVFINLPRVKKKEFVLSLVIAAAIAFILARAADWLYFNPRPFMVDGTEPLMPHGTDNGFPSNHTTIVMTLSALIYFYRRKFAALALLLSLLVGAGRVWAHVHSWIDILGGLAIGAIAGYAGVKLASYLIPILTKRLTKI